MKREALAEMALEHAETAEAWLRVDVADPGTVATGHAYATLAAAYAAIAALVPANNEHAATLELPPADPALMGRL